MLKERSTKLDNNIRVLILTAVVSNYLGEMRIVEACKADRAMSGIIVLSSDVIKKIK